MTITVVALTTAADVANFADEWRSLHDESGDTNPFAGPDWAVTWVMHFGEMRDRQVLVLCVRQDGRLIGVAPFYTEAIARGLVTIMQPVGSGHPWIGPYELPGFTTAIGTGRDVARAVVDHLCAMGGWDWANIMLGSAAPWFEPEWLPDWQHTIRSRGSRAAVVLDLTGDNLFTGRRNLKESFRRARNRLTRDFGEDGWSVRCITGSAEMASAFDRLAALHGQRAELENGQPVHADVLEDPSVYRYLKDVVKASAGHGAASIYELLIGDVVKASQLILHTTTSSYSSVSGAAEDIWPYSAVTYLQNQAVNDAKSAGHATFCLSIGPNQAKLRWTNQVVTFTEFAIVGPRGRSQALYVAAEWRDALSSHRSARRAHRT